MPIETLGMAMIFDKAKNALRSWKYLSFHHCLALLLRELCLNPLLKVLSMVSKSRSYTTHRCGALLFKLNLCLFSSALITSNAYADFSVEKIEGVWRLSGPNTGSYTLRVEKSSSQGGACKGLPTQDLVINVEDPNGEWTKSVSDFRVPALGELGACFVSARPLSDKVIALRLSYNVRKGGELKLVEVASSRSIVVDHWIKYSKTKQINRSPAEFPISERVNESFEDDLGWKRLLGLTGEATDLTSPELDKFRAFDLEKNTGLESAAIEKRALRLPLLDIPFIETPLLIKDIPLRHTRMVGGGTKEERVFEEGFNYFLYLFKKEDWERANRAFEVLETSAVGHLVDYNHAYTWSLLGQLKYELYKKSGDRSLLLSAIEKWRTGLRKTVKKGYEASEHDVYMLYRLGNELYSNNMNYALASLSTWAQKFSWPEAAVENIQIWKAEALYKLKFFDEAKDLYSKYYQSRNDLTGRARVSDYLMAASLFRIGDVYSRKKNWDLAVAAYTEAIKSSPTPGRFAFEGAWYPTILKDFSEALLNRAEANIRLGRYKAAARDYRSFMYIDGNHSYFGVALYRIADILRLSGASKERYLGALNECVFKSAGSVTDHLCRAQRAAYRITETSSEQWPRLLASVEDLYKKYDSTTNSTLFTKDELHAFSNLLSTWAFVEQKAPFQALARIENNFKLEASKHLLEWSEEFAAVSLGGYLEELLKQEKFEDVVVNYEKRQHGWMFKRNRPDVVVRVSDAFAKMGLWEQAEISLKTARKLKNLIGRKVERPFDWTPHQWETLEARVDLELAKSGRKDKAQAEKSLNKLDLAEASTRRMWLEFEAGLNSKPNASKLEKHYLALDLMGELSWKEVDSYSRVLKDLGNLEKEKQFLEQKVGSWLGRSPSSNRDTKGPELESQIRLAELRTNSGENDLALSILERTLLLGDADLSPLQRARVLYKKGKVLQRIDGRAEDAVSSMEQVRQLAPDSMWAKLSLVE